MPDTVRDAVLARAARLSAPARTLLEAVAVVPRTGRPVAARGARRRARRSRSRRVPGVGHAEHGPRARRVQARAGAPVAIEEAMSPTRRLALHPAPRSPRLPPQAPRDADFARCSPITRTAAGDAAGVVRWAPPAPPERAASSGGPSRGGGAVRAGAPVRGRAAAPDCPRRAAPAPRRRVLHDRSVRRGDRRPAGARPRVPPAARGFQLGEGDSPSAIAVTTAVLRGPDPWRPSRSRSRPSSCWSGCRRGTSSRSGVRQRLAAADARRRGCRGGDGVGGPRARAGATPSTTRRPVRLRALRTSARPSSSGG